jgi:hypothetical protein
VLGWLPGWLPACTALQSQGGGAANANLEAAAGVFYVCPRSKYELA